MLCCDPPDAVEDAAMMIPIAVAATVASVTPRIVEFCRRSLSGSEGRPTAMWRSRMNDMVRPARVGKYPQAGFAFKARTVTTIPDSAYGKKNVVTAFCTSV